MGERPERMVDGMRQRAIDLIIAAGLLGGVSGEAGQPGGEPFRGGRDRIASKELAATPFDAAKRPRKPEI